MGFLSSLGDACTSLRNGAGTLLKGTVNFVGTVAGTADAVTGTGKGLGDAVSAAAKTVLGTGGHAVDVVGHTVKAIGQLLTKTGRALTGENKITERTIYIENPYDTRKKA